MSGEMITQLQMSEEQRKAVLAKKADYEARIKVHGGEFRYSPPEVRAARIPEMAALEIVKALLAAESGIVVPDTLFRTLDDKGFFSWTEANGERPAVENFENYICVWFDYLTGDMEDIMNGTGFGSTFKPHRTP